MNPKLSLDVDYVVVVSDQHCGSSYGLMPSEYTTHEGQDVRPNVLQKWLLSCWLDFWTFAYRRMGKSKWALILNGDIIEGVHHNSLEVISSEKRDHVGMALDLLTPLMERADYIAVIEGTECHTNNAESDIARALCAVPYAKNRHAWPQIDLSVRGCNGIMRHHISTAVRPYLEASALSIQLGSDRVESCRMRRPPPQFLVSAHRHAYGAYDDGDAISVVCPPWQGLTRYGRKVVPAASTRVGGIILDFRAAGPDEPPQLIRRIYRP